MLTVTPVARLFRSRRGTGPGPEPGRYPIDTGTAELVRDRDRSTGFMLFVNGVESSHADLADPAWLEFEYLQWIAALIHQRFGAGAFEVVHLGAAGCSLARHLVATEPESRHLAVEIDGRLSELVRGWFALPRAPRLRIRVGEAGAVTAALPDACADVVVRDVFAHATTPADLITADFARQVKRVLRPGGIYACNCADAADLALSRAELATLGSVFPYLLATADAPMLKGRRRGNVILAGSDQPFDAVDLARRLRGGPAPAQLWDDATCRDFARTARVL